MLIHKKKGFQAMSTVDVHVEQIDTNWRDFVEDVELQRLALLDARIERQKQILSDSIEDRQLIMRRAIKRKRRANGGK
tara:strand:- start:270 stop:503 length:234 start_codon:yes stop_codon:yes gene_type:complete